MRTLKLFGVIGYCCFVSCGLSESEARLKCHLSQTGMYLLDFNRTSIEENVIDSLNLSELIIVFKSDSTFYTNIRVPFLDDTLGQWDAGNCGFENSGKMYFKTTPHIVDFAPCHENDSMFAIVGLSKGLSTSQYYWFKKVVKH